MKQFESLKDLKCFQITTLSGTWILERTNKWMKEINFISTHYSTAGGSMCKLFVHEDSSLFHIQHAIIIDTDFVVLQDMSELFYNIGKYSLIMSPNMSEKRVCGCLLLCDLNSMRKLNYTEIMTNSAIKSGVAHEGDQTIFMYMWNNNVVTHSGIKIIKEIGCEWVSNLLYFILIIYIFLNNIIVYFIFRELVIIGIKMIGIVEIRQNSAKINHNVYFISTVVHLLQIVGMAQWKFGIFFLNIQLIFFIGVQFIKQ